MQELEQAVGLGVAVGLAVGLGVGLLRHALPEARAASAATAWSRRLGVGLGVRVGLGLGVRLGLGLGVRLGVRVWVGVHHDHDAQWLGDGS